MKIRVSEHAKFVADKMAKIALATTTRAQLDLCCLEPGQEQKVHTHGDQDKIYFVLDGEARVTVGATEEALASGEAIVAPAGVAHGLRNGTSRRLTVLVVVTPPPAHP